MPALAVLLIQRASLRFYGITIEALDLILALITKLIICNWI